MCTGAEIAIIGSAVAGGAGSYFGGEAQGDASKEGAGRQDALARWMYEQDRGRDQESSNYLSGFLPNLPSGKDYFSPDVVNKFYDQNKSNLNFNMNTQVGDAQSSAGALGAARGFANPSGFVNYAGQGVRNSFVPQFGQNEANRSQSLMQNQDKLYNADFQKLLMEYTNRFNLTDKFGVPNGGSNVGGFSYGGGYDGSSVNALGGNSASGYTGYSGQLNNYRNGRGGNGG